MTQTLTKYIHRIKRVLVSTAARIRLCFLGGETQRIWGHLNGEFADTLPDLGSDVLAISANYAKRRGFVVDKGPGKRAQLELADGSTMLTDGIVHGLEWKFGPDGKRVVGDFHVVGGLPVDVVLNNDLVLDWNIYTDYSHLLYNKTAGDNFAEQCYIRFRGWHIEELKKIQYGFWKDCMSSHDNSSPLWANCEIVNSLDSFGPFGETAELERMDHVDREIASLPEGAREATRLGEKDRRRA
jgi:hypothetical protein